MTLRELRAKQAVQGGKAVWPLVQAYYHSQSSSFFQEKWKSLPPPARSGPVRRKNFPPPCFRVDQEKGESCRHSPDPIREQQTATAYGSHLEDDLQTFTRSSRNSSQQHTLSRNSRSIPADNRQNRKQTNRQQYKNVNI